MDKKIKVLVVDDSAAVRRALTTGLDEDPEIAVVGSARDGADAVKKVLALNPDVVTLDLEMPGMNGIQALERIMQERPTPVVLVSSISRKGAEVTVRALELGAVDFVLKDGPGGKASVESLLSELRAKLRHAVGAKVHGGAAANQKPDPSPPPRERPRSWRPRVVVIASSTGGPKALRSVVPALPADFPLPVMIVQHLPPGFTAQMAQGLDEISAVSVEEGQPNMPLLPGRVIIAPGGVHMLVSDERSVKLSRNVMIYFGKEAKANLIRRFHKALKPGGVLFIGGTEAFLGDDRDGFEKLDSDFHRKLAPSGSEARPKVA